MEDEKSIIWQIQIEILGSPPLNIEAKKIYCEYIPDKNVWTMDGRNVFFNNTGYKELKYHSANPTTLQLIPKLREIIRSAIPIFSEEIKKVQELQNQPYRTPIAGEELSAPSNNKLLRFFAPVNNNLGGRYDHTIPYF